MTHPDAPLVIRDLEFLGGMAAADGWRPPQSLPEVAFAGRSNVGKSSLLNLLMRRRAFARVSNTPGRTQEVNFFRINKEMVFVDLPGYGYAKVSKAKRTDWRHLIDGYLRGAEHLRGVVVLLDARREPNDEDLSLLDYLADLEIPAIVAVTKVDKLKTTARTAALTTIAHVTGMAPEELVPCSSISGEGRADLAHAIVDLIKEPAWHAPSQP